MRFLAYSTIEIHRWLCIKTSSDDVNASKNVWFRSQISHICKPPAGTGDSLTGSVKHSRFMSTEL